MKMQLKSVVAAACLWLAACANAADIARLQNGFSIRHETRKTMGDTTRLYLDASRKSFVDVRSADIAAIEHEPEVAHTLPSSSPVVTLHDTVTAASSNSGLDPDLIDSIIKAESNFDPHAVSRKGARGLMQLMPATATQLGVKDSFDPQANVEAGSRYLRELLLQYNRDLAKALAAYNAGAAPVDRYHGVPPYHETYSYVARIIADFNRKKLAERAALKTAERSRSSSSATKANPAAHPSSMPEDATQSKTE